MSPWSVTVFAQESTFHRSGARFGVPAVAAAITGFSTLTRRQPFRAFRRDWRSSLHLLRLNARASARSSTMKANGRIFSEEFFGPAISPGKLARSEERRVGT